GGRDDLADMRLALDLIIIERSRRRGAIQYESQTPHQLRGVANPMAHALAIEGWSLVGRIADQENVAIAPPLGDQSTEAVNGGPNNLNVVRVDPKRELLA